MSKNEKKPSTDTARNGTTRRDVLYAAAAGALSPTIPLTLGAGEAAAESAKKPNILFIYADQHRYDALGCAGDPVVLTPNLDRLAREGTRFSHLWCQSPVCRPARASLITGRYPHEHGIAENFLKPFDPSWPTLMKNLQAAGYATATIGKTHYALPEAEAFDDPTKPFDIDIRSEDGYIKSFGFDYVLQEHGMYEPALSGFRSAYTDYLKDKGYLDTLTREVRAAWQQGEGRYDAYVSQIPAEHDLTTFLAERTITWIQNRDKSKPFFMTFAPFAPHVPFGGNARWAEYYADKPMPSGPRDQVRAPNEIWAKWLETRYRISQKDKFSEERVIAARRMYYAMVSLLDEKIGVILDTLEARGELENTWVIYSADHGEMLGDHLMMEKSVFYMPSVAVPGLIRPPKGKPENQLINSPAETIDLTATMIDIAGAQPVSGMRGMSLLPSMYKQGITQRAAYSEIAGKNKTPFLTAVTDGEFRYTVDIVSKTPCELFDLKNDPQELTNLVDDPKYAARVRDMQESLIEPHIST